MKDLLFLAHRLPYPPDKGDKIRSWNLLRHLAKRYRIHLGAFIDDPEDHKHAEFLKLICASAHFETLTPRIARLQSARGFFKGEALSFPYYRHSGMSAWVDSVMEQVKPSIAFAFSSQVAPYILSSGPNDMMRVVDFVDVDSDKWRQYAENKPFPSSWIYGREARLLADAERRIAQSVDASILVSEAEADLFRKRVGLCTERVIGIGNGVDTEFFAPETVGSSPYENHDGPVIAFAGVMDYWANVDAVQWFAHEIFPEVRRQIPTARFFICGARPTAAVLRLGELDGVQVTGRVDDIRGYVHFADVSVAPLRIARGIQNKVLEAMALRTPVVCTSQALEGIAAIPEAQIAVADSTADLAAEIVDLLSDRSRRRKLGDAGRALVEREYSWPAQLACLSRLLDGEVDEDRQPPRKTATLARVAA